MIDAKILEQKLYDKVIKAGWGDVFNPWIKTGELQQIIQYLYDQSLKGEDFTPGLKNIFRAFEECPYDKLRVVIIGQDPYPQDGTADGIAFSTQQATTPKSLQIIHEALGGHKDLPNDLTPWANQGILLLNTALTCAVGRPGSHTKGWSKFITNVLWELDIRRPGLIYVFMGSVAKDYMYTIEPDFNHVFHVKHPASAYYNNSQWDGGEIFKKVESLIEWKYNDKIKWI